MKSITRFLSVLFFVCCAMPTYSATRGPSQSVINRGTKVSESTATSNSCQDKYTACMDMGCMLDNDSGGRCQCSNRIKELNAEFNQIKKSEAQTQLITENSVEIIKLGELGQQLYDDITADQDEEDVDLSVTDSEQGDRLRAKMHDICIEKIPECKSQLTLLKNIYAQKVKSDCNAYENALKIEKNKSSQRAAAAKTTVRKAALEQYQSSNKYDLGQCVNEFSQCMQTTAECGADFTGCVDTVAKESIYAGVTNTVAIQGENSSVIIAKSTMDMLESKKIMCESVLSKCVSVRDNVWDSFLKISAPQIKLAESKAESNIRTSCLENISNCFVKACKDNIDGNDSYDMCLTRPETIKSMCKVELEPCLAATGGSYEVPQLSTLWPSVLSKLSAMRVDSCTAELKECMQSVDRCGPDYSQCVGLDTNIIMRMCPYDKLVGCQKVYGNEKVQGDEIYDNIAQIVQGIILNIDNDMLQTCELAVENSVSKTCGSVEDCAVQALGQKIGAQSLRYQVCEYSTDSPDSTAGFKWFNCRSSVNDISDYELGRLQNAQSEELGYVAPFAGVISGIIKWESIQVTDDGKIDIDAYMTALEENKDSYIPEEEKARVMDELQHLQSGINSMISSVESDYFVQYCINGREVPGVTDQFKNNKVRFPKLSNTIRVSLANAALLKAKENYYQLYDIYSEQMQMDLAIVNERVANNLKLNGEDAKRAAARAACVNLAAVSAFAKAPVWQSLWAQIIVGIVVIGAAIVATVFTAGAWTNTFHFVAGIIGLVFFGATAIGAIAVGIDEGLASNEREDDKAFISTHKDKVTETHGEFFANEWNYREKITTDFDNDTGICKKCVSKMTCEKTKWHIFSDRTCSKWASEDFEDERCTEIQF